MPVILWEVPKPSVLSVADNEIAGYPFGAKLCCAIAGRYCVIAGGETHKKNVSIYCWNICKRRKLQRVNNWLLPVALSVKAGGTLLVLLLRTLRHPDTGSLCWVPSVGRYGYSFQLPQNQTGGVGVLQAGRKCGRFQRDKTISKRVCIKRRKNMVGMRYPVPCIWSHFCSIIGVGFEIEMGT